MTIDGIVFLFISLFLPENGKVSDPRPWKSDVMVMKIGS